MSPQDTQARALVLVYSTMHWLRWSCRSGSMLSELTLEALSFYERHGFRAIAFSDGSANEERCPDVLYELASPVSAGHKLER
jgi:hypothetical protein